MAALNREDISKHRQNSRRTTPKDNMKLNTNTLWSKTGLFIAALALTVSAHAGTGVTTTSSKNLDNAVQAPEKSIYDNIWSLATIYKDKSNPYIEEFSLTGEWQFQWADGDSNRGSYGTRNRPSTDIRGDIEERRFRLGFKAQVFQDFKVVGAIDANPYFDPEFYKDIYSAYISYAPNDAFNLSIGKTKTKFFGQEQSTPSAELIIFEQSLLINALIPKELTGVWINGKTGNWVYALAGFAGDYEKEFSKFDKTGSVIQAYLGYDFGKSLGVDSALLRLDYQGSTDKKNTDGPAKFANAFSLNTTFQNGRFGFYDEFIGATGRGTQGDVYGFTFAPSYYVIPKALQVIFRYQYAHGDNNGLKLQGRYEGLAPEIQDTKGTGNDYNAAYLGLNYYLYGHKLKVMTGLEYNDLSGGKKDFSGWTYLAGLRLAF